MEHRRTPESSEIEISVVIPCLNESETLGTCIEKCIRTFREHAISGEIVVADNGSTDGSLDIAKMKGARVLHIPQKGYGAALQGGIAGALGRFIIMGDADDSYDFCEIPHFLEKLRTGSELVLGCRLPSGGGTVMPGAMPWLHRWIGNPGLSFLVRWWFRAPIHDVYCGLRGFTKSLYERLDLRCTGMEFATEMVIKSSLFAAQITEVPITLHPDGRKTRKPHLRTFHDGWRTLRFFLIYSPKWLFLVPGFLLIFLGLTGYALALPRLTIGSIHPDAHTLLFASLAILVGYQSIQFGILAKVFAVTEGLLPYDKRLDRGLRLIPLERGIMLGLLFSLVGIALLGVAMRGWQLTGFGDLDYAKTMRIVVPGITLCALGAQTIMACFLLNLRHITTMKWIEHLHARQIEGRRTRILADRLSSAIPQGSTVLDVGCGDGRVAAEIMRRRPDVRIEGVEVLVRDSVAIPMTPFDGSRLPFPDRQFDVVLFVDVLRHTEDPMTLLQEAKRVARNCIVIKDHLKEGVLGGVTLRFMDWVGNCRYGVVLPYNYWKRTQWKRAASKLSISIELWNERLHLYPWPFSLLFDRSLHVLMRWKRTT